MTTGAEKSFLKKMLPEESEDSNFFQALQGLLGSTRFKIYALRCLDSLNEKIDGDAETLQQIENSWHKELEQFSQDLITLKGKLNSEYYDQTEQSLDFIKQQDQYLKTLSRLTYSIGMAKTYYLSEMPNIPKEVLNLIWETITGANSEAQMKKSHSVNFFELISRALRVNIMNDGEIF